MIIDALRRPPAILIVDDDPDILAVLHLIVQNVGTTYDIIPIYDARSALRHLTQRTVPLLITDYMMPGMDGLHLTAAVKAISPMTHVILATAYGSAALEQRAREHQVDTFLPKTALFDRLEDIVWSVLHPAAVQQCRPIYPAVGREPSSSHLPRSMHVQPAGQPTRP
jgi:two-component system, response regulator, stage 0 sporulation protein F